MKKMSEEKCKNCGEQLTESSFYDFDGEWEGTTIECLNCGELIKEID